MHTNKSYRTRQRQLLVDYLRVYAASHPLTAREVALGMHKMGCSVGETTVYRGLERLQEEGFVRRWPGEEGGSVWQFVGQDSDCANHVHLKCTVCGEVVRRNNRKSSTG